MSPSDYRVFVPKGHFRKDKGIKQVICVIFLKFSKGQLLGKMDLDDLCHTCGEKNYNYLLRSKHQIASHSGKLLGCTECSYTAFGPKNLSNHMQKHQESTPL